MDTVTTLSPARLGTAAQTSSEWPCSRTARQHRIVASRSARPTSTTLVTLASAMSTLKMLCLLVPNTMEPSLWSAAFTNSARTTPPAHAPVSSASQLVHRLHRQHHYTPAPNQALTLLCAGPRDSGLLLIVVEHDDLAVRTCDAGGLVSNAGRARGCIRPYQWTQSCRRPG